MTAATHAAAGQSASRPRRQTIHGDLRPDPDAVTLVDAHHHLWDLGQRAHPWLCDHPEPGFFLGDYSPLKRDYLPADYRRDASRHNVLATVHCEAEWRRDDQVGETEWLTGLHEQNERLPAAIVAHAWFHTDNAEAVLARQAAFPLVRGIRSKPVTSPTPAVLPSGTPGSMTDPKWLEGLARLERHGLSWDLRVPSWHLQEAADVAAAFPRLPIVLNHTGFPWDRSDEGLRRWQLAMEGIARQPNVWLKVSEFGLRDQPWDYESNRRVVRTAIAIFGMGRCMFASNFPVAGLRIGFDDLVVSISRMLDDFSDSDRRSFFVDNAARFYRLDL